MKKQKITIEESIAKYLNWKKTHTRTTHRRYGTYLFLFTKFTDVKYLSELSNNHIVNFQVYMHEERAYSNNTIAYATRIIKNYIEFWGGRRETDISVREIIAHQFEPTERVVVEQDEFLKLSEALDENDLDDLIKKLIIHILWDTGIRVGELVQLKINNINNDTLGGIRSAKIKTEKNHRYNIIVWSNKTSELMKKYLKFRFLFPGMGSDLFIGQRLNMPINPKTVQRWINQTCERANINKQITPHSFRHGKAHDILNKGGSIYDVQHILRHKNFHSALNYMNLNEGKSIERSGSFLD